METNNIKEQVLNFNFLYFKLSQTITTIQKHWKRMKEIKKKKIG
jgi:hypothetical protein